MHDRLTHPRTGRGFTLVEMLTVLMILAIILGLGVGISRYLMEEAARKQTEVTQAVLMDAILRYKTITGSPPASLNALVNTSDPKLDEVKAIALKVQKDKFDGTTAWDGWGSIMDYQAAGGRGGTPVIISGGSDRNMTTTDNNVRSDSN